MGRVLSLSLFFFPSDLLAQGNMSWSPSAGLWADLLGIRLYEERWDGWVEMWLLGNESLLLPKLGPPQRQIPIAVGCQEESG